LFSGICAAQPNTSNKNDTLSLTEVVVSAKSPAIRVVKDTIVYTADSFVNNPEASTEDVLKRLPGVEVERDGKIMVHGKPVSKLLINNREYVGADLQTVIQSLPAEILDKIQVADLYDEDAQFTKRKNNSQEKVINLQLKKQYNGGLYGKAQAGYGTRERYQAGAFANMMREDMRITGLVNINKNGMADISNDKGSDNISGWRAPGMREEKKGNINFSLGNSRKAQIDASYSFSTSKNYLERNSLRTTSIASLDGNMENDSTIFQRQNSLQNNKSYHHRLDLRSQYYFTEKTSIRTNISVSYGQQASVRRGADTTAINNMNDFQFSRISQNSSDRKNGSIALTNTLMKKFAKENKTLVIKLNGSYGTNSSKGMNDNTNIYYSTGSAMSVINNRIDTTHSYNAGVAINHNEPISKSSLLGISLNSEYGNGVNDKDVLVLQNGTLITDTI
jgi:hypothetical protein